MKFRYEIDKNNAVWIFLNDSKVASVFQPDWADGTPWANKTEAENWAKAWILSMTDETAPLPGNSPNEPTVPRPEFIPLTIAELPVAEPDAELEAAIAAENALAEEPTPAE
jgi:hypothetical protein